MAVLSITNTWPTNGRTQFPVSVPLFLTAGEKIVADANYSSISLTGPSGSVTITLSIINNLLVITPTNDLGYNKAYTLTVPVGAVVGVSGAVMSGSKVAAFTTAPQLAPHPTNFIGLMQASVYPCRPYFYVMLQFANQNIPPAGYNHQGFSGILLKDWNGNVDNSVTFGPAFGNSPDVAMQWGPNGLTCGASNLYSPPIHPPYNLNLPHDSVLDAYGGTLDNDYVFTLSTEPPIALNASEPGSGAPYVPITVKISVSGATFPGPNFSNITLKHGGTTVETSVSIIGYSYLLIEPTSGGAPTNLLASTVYTVDIPAGALYTNEHKTNPDFTYSFTTAATPAAPDMTAPTIVGVNPGIQFYVPIGTVFAVRYDRDVIVASNVNNLVQLTCTWPTGPDTNPPVTCRAAGHFLVITPVDLLPYSALTLDLAVPAGAVTSLGGTPSNAPGSVGTSPPFSDGKYHWVSQAEIQNLQGYDWTTIESPLAIASHNPTTNQTNVPTCVVLHWICYWDTWMGTAWDDITVKETISGTTVAITKWTELDQVYLVPNSWLKPSTQYTITVPINALITKYGTPLLTQYQWSFTTSADPTVQSTYPTSNATGIPVSDSVIVTTTHEIMPVNGASPITLALHGGAIIPTTIHNLYNIIAITPTSPLQSGTKYDVTIPAGALERVYDQATISAATTFSFTTVAGGTPVQTSSKEIIFQ